MIYHLEDVILQDTDTVVGMIDKHVSRDARGNVTWWTCCWIAIPKLNVKLSW